MTTDEYVPHESYVREAWVDRLGTDNPLFMDEAEDEFDRFLARVRRDAAREALDRAEHRIARLEAQTSIRGRAVVMYRERARQAEERIEAVRALHQRAWHGELDYCRRCVEVEGAIWPCPTIRALEG